MKTDRELLELAAKAARYKVRWHDVWKSFVHELPINTDNPPTLSGQRLVWAPLQDNGDALRLAVKLKLEMTRDFDRIDVFSEGDVLLATEYIYDNPTTDVYAATRVAIVRAAAAIGESMP